MGIIMNYESIAKKIELAIVEMNARSKASHSGTALSTVDILTVLYFKILNIDPMNPQETK